MMKPAFTTTIFVCVLAAGLASAQSPSIIQNTRNTMNTVSNNATAASNEALGVHQSAPAAASATHASAKSRGVAVIAPAKSSSTHVAASAAGGKKKGGGEPGPGSRGRAQGASEASAYGSGRQRSTQQFGERRRRSERRAGRPRRQVCCERATGSLHQSGGEPRGRFGMQHRQEVSGNRGHQPARRGARRKRLHCCGQQRFE